MKRFGVFLFIVLTAAYSVASGAVSERPWSSMFVTGTVEIYPDGGIRDYGIDHPEKIPSIVLNVIKQTVAGWRFQVQVPGHVIARARMNLRIVAKPVGSTSLSIEVEGVSFGSDGDDPEEDLTNRYRPVPDFPSAVVREGSTAVVYMLMRVGRDGHVLDAGAEQVNFTAHVPIYDRQRISDILIRSCQVALRKWTFNVPTKGALASKPYWLARVPVHFMLGPARLPEYGSWEAYLPGPRLPIPWLKDKTMLASAPDAVPDSDVQMLDGKLKLSTPQHEN